MHNNLNDWIIYSVSIRSLLLQLEYRMYKNKKSVRRGDDDYNLTYYEDSIEKVVERVDDVDKQLKDVNRRVSANLTVLKCALFTIICLILIMAALI